MTLKPKATSTFFGWFGKTQIKIAVQLTANSRVYGPLLEAALEFNVALMFFQAEGLELPAFQNHHSREVISWNSDFNIRDVISTTDLIITDDAATILLCEYFKRAYVVASAITVEELQDILTNIDDHRYTAMTEGHRWAMDNRFVTSAVIPCGGAGLRVKPVCGGNHKEMMAVGGFPLIFYSIRECLRLAIHDIVLVISPAKRDLLQYVRSIVPPEVVIRYVVQDEPTGLGAAVFLAEPEIRSDYFLIILPDVCVDISDVKTLVSTTDAIRCPAILTTTVSLDEASKYGNVRVNSRWVADIVEKPSPALYTTVAAGRYVILKKIFDFKDQLVTGAGGEIQLTDSLAALCKTTLVRDVPAKGIIQDCGSIDGYLSVRARVLP